MSDHKSTQARIAELEAKLESMRCEAIFAHDDLHKLKARVHSLLKNEPQRLRDAVVAGCERTPPKTHIVRHHNEHTADTIDKVLELVSD